MRVTFAANRIAREADLVIGIGTRYSDFTTASKTAFQNPKVKFINLNVAEFDAFKHSVQVIPEVLECHMVAGGFDYLVKARVKDMAAYRRFLGQVMVDLPGVKETRTYAVMEEVKTDSPLPV